MKNTTHLLISILLISIHTIFASSAAAVDDAPPPVLDAAGKQLRAGPAYYILPAICSTGGGGLTPAAAGNRTCPPDVVQNQLEVTNGVPVTFRPVNSNKNDVVRVSTDQNIKFSGGASTCAQSPSTVWKLDYDESIEKYVVSTGGVEGNPGLETMHSWFKIEEYYESDYKLVFCPTVCLRCRGICRDVAVLVEGGRRRFTLAEDSDAPFRVQFKKASRR